jgi:hypothetical protein
MSEIEMDDCSAGTEIEQAKLYARDLSELYRAERKRREELAEEKLVLEFKVRELEALNKLFQSYLEQRFAALRAYAELIEDIKNLLQGQLPGALEENLGEILGKAELHKKELEQALSQMEKRGS